MSMHRLDGRSWHDELVTGYNSEHLPRAEFRGPVHCPAMASRRGFPLYLCGSQHGNMEDT